MEPLFLFLKCAGIVFFLVVATVSLLMMSRRQAIGATTKAFAFVTVDRKTNSWVVQKNQ